MKMQKNGKQANQSNADIPQDVKVHSAETWSWKTTSPPFSGQFCSQQAHFPCRSHRHLLWSMGQCSQPRSGCSENHWGQWGWEHHAQGGEKNRLCCSLLTNTGLPGKRIASIVMETASALTVVPPWEVNTAWMVVTLNDPLCTLINICLREKHKPAGKLISFDTNTVGLFFFFF